MLYCTVTYFTVLHCTVLHCNVPGAFSFAHFEHEVVHIGGNDHEECFEDTALRYETKEESGMRREGEESEREKEVKERKVKQEN